MTSPIHYYEPQSRLQQRDKLRHLLRFSDFVILVIGEAGAGKSALLEQLLPDADSGQGRAACLRLDATTDVTRLLQQLTAALDCEPSNDNRQRLKQLHQLARQLREDGLPLIVLLDDADFLTNNALELLVNFATIEKGVPPRVLLAGTAEFEQRFRELGLAEQLESHLHIERLEPFLPEESSDFVASLLPEGVELSRRQLAQLIERSQGYPGRLRDQVIELSHRGRLKPVGSGRLPLPPKHISAAIMVLLLVFGVALWQYLPDDEDAPAVRERITLPLPVGREDAARVEIAAAPPAEAVAEVPAPLPPSPEPETEQTAKEKAPATPEPSADTTPPG
ncbi:MAG: ATP-binding protein, partial [Pseudomonadota bacterium]|nr:ATP-binding protein [Pseudomonadota bacterium]